MIAKEEQQVSAEEFAGLIDLLRLVKYESAETVTGILLKSFEPDSLQWQRVEGKIRTLIFHYQAAENLERELFNEFVSV